MKLTIEEYKGLVDSRLVVLEDAIREYKDKEPIETDMTNVYNLKAIVKSAEALLEAYEAKVEAEEDEQIEEYKEYSLDLTAGLDGALSIRGKK